MYLLRTNVPDVDPVKLWAQYIQLVDAEWAFRITKDELELRPIWHRNQDRVLAHDIDAMAAAVRAGAFNAWCS